MTKTKLNSLFSLKYYFLISFIALLLDQISKKLIEIQAIKIYYIYNEGAAMGLFRELDPKIRIPFFMVFSIIAVIIMLYYIFTISLKERLTLFGLSLILGGAFGNFVDRIFKGRVLDFIDTGVWPIFNLADSAITIGVCILIFKTFFPGKKEESTSIEPSEENK